MIFARSLVVLAAAVACLADTSRAIELLVFGPEGLIEGQQPTTKSPTRSKKQATNADNSPQTIEDKLNDLRRTVQSSNMNYANWNEDLVKYAADLVDNGCRIQTQVSIDGNKFPYARGFTGLMTQPYSSVAGVLQSAYNQGSTQSYYRQLMSSRMTDFGCAVGTTTCFYRQQSDSSSVLMGQLFACIFSYQADPDSVQLYLSGTSCSFCDNNTLWCDDELCRDRCSLSQSDCDTCQTDCSTCDQVFWTNCQCVCYYGASSTARCAESAYSTVNHPVCSAKPIDDSGDDDNNHHDDDYGNQRMPVGWIICVIISSVILLTLAATVAIWQCIRHRKCCAHRLGSQRQIISPSGANGHDNVANTVYEEFGPGFVPILTPPPYIDSNIKPPPYDPVEPIPDSKPPGEMPTAPPKVVEDGMPHVYDNGGMQQPVYDNADNIHI